MKYCNKCGNPLKDGYAFCNKCGAELPFDKKDRNNKQSSELTKSFQMDFDDSKSNKLKITVIVCAVVVVITVVLSVLVVLFLMNFKSSDNKKENYVPTSVEQTTVIETTIVETTAPPEKEILLKADNELGYVFNLTFEEFIESYNNAVDKLQVNTEKLKISDFKEVTFSDKKDMDSKYGVDFFCQGADGIHLYLDKNSNKIFAIILTTETSMENLKTKICLIIKSVNPDFKKEDVQNCYIQLVNSEESFSQNSGETIVSYLYLNNIRYELSRVNDYGYCADILPCTEEYYQQQLEAVRTNGDFDDSDVSYVVEDFGQFYADIPDGWTYEVENGAIYFYEEYNHSHDETGSAGYLCDIRGIDPQGSDTPSPNSEYIGGTGTIDYYVEFPMGMGVIEDETASQKMQIARSQLEDFVDSIIFK